MKTNKGMSSSKCGFDTRASRALNHRRKNRKPSEARFRGLKKKGIRAKARIPSFPYGFCRKRANASLSAGTWFLPRVSVGR